MSSLVQVSKFDKGVLSLYCSFSMAGRFFNIKRAYNSRMTGRCEGANDTTHGGKKKRFRGTGDCFWPGRWQVIVAGIPGGGLVTDLK